MSATNGANASTELTEAFDDVVDVEWLAAGLLDQRVLGDRTFAHQASEAIGIEDVAHPDAHPARLVGVGGTDALQGGADLVVTAHRLGDRVVGLVPREDQVRPARHLQLGARDAPGFEHVDLVEERRQVDDDTVGDHGDHVVVEDARGDELQGVLLAIDDDGVSGVVAALVAHDVRVLLRQQVDDLCFALIAPLGSDDDGDGHARSPEWWLERREMVLPTSGHRPFGCVVEPPPLPRMPIEPAGRSTSGPVVTSGPILTATERERVTTAPANASTLPPHAYTDPAVWRREADAIFRRDWVCVARADQVPTPGDYVAVDLLDQPVIVIRGDDGTIRAMSNVCLHRAMPLVSGTGSARWIVCPYHRWSYGRDGALHTAPLMEDAADFDIEQCRLPQLAVEEWQGFVFVSMDPDAAPLAPRLEPLAEHLAPYGLANLVIADTIEFDSPWNWKLLVENFMEAYHHIGPHRDTFQVSNPAKDSLRRRQRGRAVVTAVHARRGRTR